MTGPLTGDAHAEPEAAAALLLDAAECATEAGLRESVHLTIESPIPQI